MVDNNTITPNTSNTNQNNQPNNTVNNTQTTQYPDISLNRIIQAHHYTEGSLNYPLTIKANLLPEGGNPSQVQNVGVQVTYQQWDDSGTTITLEEQQLYDEFTPEYNSNYPGACYSFTIPAEYTQQPSIFTIQWAWTVNNQQRYWNQYYLVRNQLPLYLSLTDSEKALCEACLNQWCLLHDNHYGNSQPALSEDVQVHYDYDVVANCMIAACQEINTHTIVTTNFTVGNSGTSFMYGGTGGGHFPVRFYNLLMLLTLANMADMNVIGYAETPEINGSTGVPYVDRKAYYQKWVDIEKRYRDRAEPQFKAYKQTYYNPCTGALLVGGGMFGGAGTSSLISNQTIGAIQRNILMNQYFPVNIILPE